jgi:hypothetical protein
LRYRRRLSLERRRRWADRRDVSRGGAIRRRILADRGKLIAAAAADCPFRVNFGDDRPLSSKNYSHLNLAKKLIKEKRKISEISEKNSKDPVSCVGIRGLI